MYLIRIPSYKNNNQDSIRIEYRAPDPSCNPYLAFAVMLTAGLAGIEGDYNVPDPVEENVYQLTDDTRLARGIGTLPESLGEAIAITENSQIVKQALGDHVFNSFVLNKKIEWNEYRAQVTDYEIKRYLSVL